MSEEENVPKSTKTRVYVSRKEEFLNTTQEQMLEILAATKAELKNAKVALEANPTDETLVRLNKDLINKRVRIYTRLEKLGYHMREESKKNKAPVATVPEIQVPVTPAPELPKVPEDVPPAQ